MEPKLVIIACLLTLLIGFVGGYILGASHRKKLDCGSIVFEQGEEGPKCTMKFDCNEEELMQKYYVVLKVIHKSDS